MAEKRKQLTDRQRKILELLTTYDALTTKKIIEMLYPDAKIYIKGTLIRNSSKYRSVLRTLRVLQDKGLVTKAAGQTVWKTAK